MAHSPIPITELHEKVTEAQGDLQALADLKVMCDGVNAVIDYLGQGYIGTENPEIKLTFETDTQGSPIEIVIPADARGDFRDNVIDLLKRVTFPLLESVAGIIPRSAYDNIVRPTREYEQGKKIVGGGGD